MYSAILDEAMVNAIRFIRMRRILTRSGCTRQRFETIRNAPSNATGLGQDRTRACLDLGNRKQRLGTVGD
jgi:hypothetical protein